MFGVRLDVTATESIDWDAVAKRKWPKILGAGLLEAMRYWRANYLALHWSQRAKSKYAHQPRSRKWIERRHQMAARGIITEGGGDIDNLVTGLFRELVKGWHEINARGKRVTFRCYGPRYVSLRPKGDGGPYKWGEVTNTTSSEQRTLGDRMVRKIPQEIERQRTKKTTKL